LKLILEKKRWLCQGLTAARRRKWMEKGAQLSRETDLKERKYIWEEKM